MEVIPQKVWRWKIAAYLFLAGMGAGAYIAGVLSDLIAGVAIAAKIGITFCVPILAASTLFLIWDLGHPEKFFKAALHPGSSWISRGFFILSALLATGVVTWALYVWPSNVLVQSVGWRTVLEIIGLVAAVATCVYTGILIGIVVSRPFWNSPLLPILFLISAVSTGIAGIFFVTPIWYGLRGTAVPATLAGLLDNLGRVDAGLIVLEAIAVYLYLAVVFDRAPESANLLLRGPMASLFWGGFAVLGLILPLLIEYVALTGLSDSNTRMAATAFAGALVIVGGFLLRALILAAGIRSPLYVRAAFRVRPGV